MDQEKIEAIIRGIVTQEVTHQATQPTPTKAPATDGEISPLLQDLRDAVQEQSAPTTSTEGESSALLEGIKRDVQNGIG